MKKIILIVFVAIIFVGCKNNDKIESPNKVFTSFTEALSKKDLAKARELCTNESKTVLDFLENWQYESFFYG
jgi:PBP1b-binding outer membrane lipoprotein LpoB